LSLPVLATRPGPSSASAPAWEPADAAASAAVQALLNCYVREGGPWLPELGGDARFPLPDGRGQLVAGLAHHSATGRHRFLLPVRWEQAGHAARRVELPLLACLLLDALGRDDPRGAGDAAELLARILDSTAAVTRFLALRADEIERLWDPAPLSFAATESALLLGHPLHPTPKSRNEMSPAQRDAYAPETAARFQLHWLAADRAHVAHDSATGVPAPALVRGLLEAVPDVGDRVLVPVHPWELELLRDRADVAALLASGALEELGPLGSPVTATTSVRTVQREDWPWQLKLSLHLRVTNSMRLTLPKELERAVEAARLMQTSVGAAAARAAARWVCLQDPAYLAVRGEHGLIDGLSVLLREQRWGAGADTDVSAVAVLCQDHPSGGPSRLAAIVARLAAAEGRSTADVAREWFARYCEVVPVSVLRLYLDVGLCFEPHAQNTLLELSGGWPERAVYRDSQGYFHREAAHEDMCAIIPALGERSESIFPEALADERLVYYPFVNNALGVISALGIAGCVDEEVLLADLRRVIERERARGGRYPATLLDRLLDDAEWPCKANLRTRLHDLDELVGDISTQSVYVRIPNPLAPA